jgi:hypothetical protein
MERQGVETHTGRKAKRLDETKTINPEKGKNKHAHQTPTRAKKRGDNLAGNKLSVKQACAVHTLESVSKSKDFENRKRKR